MKTKELREPRLGIHEDGTEELKSWEDLYQQCLTAADHIDQLEAENERLRDGISKVIVESMSKETSIAWLRIMLNDILEPADE